MKVILENLGVLKHAEFELGDLTVICGKNNTGKTYATHALHGFLNSWRGLLELYFGILKDDSGDVRLIKTPKRNERLLDELFKDLDREKFCKFDIAEYAKENMNDTIQDMGKIYSKVILSGILATSPKKAENYEFKFRVDEDSNSIYKNVLGQQFKRNITTESLNLQNFIRITKAPNEPNLEISIVQERKKDHGMREDYELFIKDKILSALIDIVYADYFSVPRTFIMSPERTGASLFKNELNFTRNRIIEHLSSENKEIDPFSVLDQTISRYPLAVRRNVDYVRSLDIELKKESFLFKDYKDILDDLKKIVGGDYGIDKITDEPLFMPYKSKEKLKMGESSSSVRTLLMLDVYLYHTAQKGDLLIIDEPELNLHPEKQRRMARLLARLVNVGIKVFITTHSDYIIRELNNLIKMDEKERDAINKIEAEQEYKPDELLCLNGKKGGIDIKAYIAEEGLVQEKGKKRKVTRQILRKAEVTKDRGMALDTFDDTISRINRIQDKIDWG